MGSGQDVVKYPTMYRTAPHKREFFSLKRHSRTEVEKACSKERRAPGAAGGEGRKGGL